MSSDVSLPLPFSPCSPTEDLGKNLYVCMVFIFVGAFPRVMTLLLPYVAVLDLGHSPLLQRALHSGSTISTILNALDILRGSNL